MFDAWLIEEISFDAGVRLFFIVATAFRLYPIALNILAIFGRMIPIYLDIHFEKACTTEMVKESTTDSQFFAVRRLRRFIKLCLAIPILLVPIIFPKWSAILVPCSVLALVILVLVGPKGDRSWKWSTYRRNRKILDDSSSNTTDLDPTNPFGMYDDYY